MLTFAGVYVPRVEVSPRSVTLLKRRTLDGRRDRGIQARAGHRTLCDPIDRTIARLASVCGLTGLGALDPEIVATLLDLLLATGRVHWHSTKHPPLRRADVSDAKFVWQLDSSDGRQRPGVEGRKPARLLPSDPLWYADPENNTAGTIDLGIAGELASALALAPSLNPAQARRAHGCGIAFDRARHSAAHVGRAARRRRTRSIVRLELRGFPAIADLTFAYGNTIVGPDDVTFDFQERTSKGSDGMAATARVRSGREGDFGRVRFTANRVATGAFSATDRSWVRFLAHHRSSFARSWLADRNRFDVSV